MLISLPCQQTLEPKANISNQLNGIYKATTQLGLIHRPVRVASARSAALFPLLSSALHTQKHTHTHIYTHDYSLLWTTHKHTHSHINTHTGSLLFDLFSTLCPSISIIQTVCLSLYTLCINKSNRKNPISIKCIVLKIISSCMCVLKNSIIYVCLDQSILLPVPDTQRTSNPTTTRTTKIYEKTNRISEFSTTRPPSNEYKWLAKNLQTTALRERFPGLLCMWIREFWSFSVSVIFAGSENYCENRSEFSYD